MAKPKARRAIIREWMALAREITTNRPAGTGFCKSPRSNGTACRTAANGARRDHGMAAATHRTTLILRHEVTGGCECVLGC